MIYKFSLIEKILLGNDLIPHPFTDAASSVGLGFALGTAVKLNITDALGNEYNNLHQIAQKAQVSVNGCELILDCLVALGYVSRKGDEFAFTKRGFKSLSRQSPHNFRYFILFCDYLYKSYLNLDSTVKNGAYSGENMIEKMTEYEWELFSRAMIDISSTNVKEVAGKIKLSTKDCKMLDLGGSHGQYSIELCKKYPHLTSEILDFPPVKKYADECISKYNMQKQVKFVASDFMKDELPPNQDVILAFNIIHGLNQSENENLAKKIYNALHAGGKYVILDQIRGIGGSSQMAMATTSYMALNLLHQAGGKTYSHGEVEAIAKKAGFQSAILKKLNAPGFGVIICQK